MTTALWATAGRAADWLDATNGTDPHQTAMQLMKITEEAGEVTAAYIGMTGQNPRKGVTLERHATRVGRRIAECGPVGDAAGAA